VQVFSQWQGALFLVSKALDAQDPPIKHVALTGTRHRGQASTPPQSLDVHDSRLKGNMSDVR
jgi:hypothetical protein